MPNRYGTPKKPDASRTELAANIVQEAMDQNWAPVDLVQHLMTFFTAVDLQMILDAMKNGGSRERIH